MNRVLLILVFLGICAGILLDAILKEKTGLFQVAPAVAGFIVFFILFIKGLKNKST